MSQNHDNPSQAPGGLLVRRPFLSSVIVVSGLFVLEMFFFRPYFQLNDDTFKLFFAKGVGTNDKPYEYIGYSSTVLGLLLKALYASAPRIQWYTCNLVACQFLSVLALFYSFQTGPNSRFKVILFLASTTAIFCYWFTDLQFTLTSSLAFAGAFFLMAQLWRSENPKALIPALFLAGILLLESVLIRADAFFLSGLAALPVAFFLVWKQPLTRPRAILLRFLLAMAVLLGCLVGFDRYYYNHEAGWREFNRFDAQRVTFQDYRRTDFNVSTETAFRAAGWTVNDYNMIMGWYFMDEDVYSVDKLKKLNDYFSAFSLYGKNADSTFPAIFSLRTNLMVTLFFLAFLFFTPRKALGALLANFGWVLLILLYLCLNLRASERLSLPMLFFLLLASIFFAIPRKLGLSGNREVSDWLPKAGAAFALLLSLYAFLFLLQERGKNKTLRYYEDVLRASMQSFHPQKSQLYVIWDSAFPFELIHAFDDFELFRDFNLITLAVYQRAPPAYAMMGRFGVKNLFRDIVDNPDLFLICSPWEMNAYKIHMREKYQLETDFEETFSSPFFKVYRIHSFRTSPKPVKGRLPNGKA